MRMRVLIVMLSATITAAHGGRPLVLSAAPSSPDPWAAAAVCESLSSAAWPTVAVTLAQAVPAGDFTLPGTAQRFSNLPAFCRVAATLKPSADSDIKIEVWMPVANWNGKFQGVGNGGWAGTIAYAALAAGLAAGYATASTDTGHVGGNASFALGHPEKYIDMGYRAVHEMSVQGKAIVNRFYASAPPSRCGTDARRADARIAEAERYPADYDAIIAGAPSIYQMQLNGARVALNLTSTDRRTAHPASEIPTAPQHWRSRPATRWMASGRRARRSHAMRSTPTPPV